MPARVLIVDDSTYARARLKDMMESHGLAVVGEAANVVMAVELYGKLKPDLVTLDMVMPDVNGIEAVKTLRQCDPRCRIVLITAIRHGSGVEQAKELGITVVNKPVDWPELEQAITQAMK
ncbi:MAG: response regulator [Elusimicrobia bacterium]|nr:response regulator [Elusimicrobiota bacterium]